MNEDTSVVIDVLDNDVDVDGDTLTIITMTQASHGIVSMNSSGVLTYIAAQNREIESSAALVAIRRLLLDNRVNLHLALGGSFTL